MNKSRAYRSFLLTAWQERTQQDQDEDQDEDESMWHFGLEDIRGRHQRRLFMTLEEVIEYVKEKLEERS